MTHHGHSNDLHVYVCLKQIQADYVRCNSDGQVWLVVAVSVCEQDGEINNGRMADTPTGVTAARSELRSQSVK